MNVSDQKIAAFRQMHERGCFVMPNAWDVGSARWLRALGFKALATTSAGAAWAMVRPDTKVPRDEMLAHIQQMVEATDLPVNADFESGFSADTEEMAKNIKLCLETGVAALSIEDSKSENSAELYSLDRAVERIKVARAAVDAFGNGALLVARAECFLTGQPEPLQEAILRLKAYAAAGADVLYAPGPRSPDEIAAIVAAVAPKPVNLIVYWPSELKRDDWAALGVRRISVGSALARVAWNGFARASQMIASNGSFAGFDATQPRLDLDGFFDNDRRMYP